MFIFRIRITMSDGSSGRCTGLFATACAAVRRVSYAASCRPLNSWSIAMRRFW